MTKALLMFVAATFATPALAATITVEMNSDKLTVNNQMSDRIVLKRTHMTPNKVKIDINPMVKYRQVCVEQGVHQTCGYNSFQCGNDLIRRCDHLGRCWYEQFPRYCCWSEYYCRRYENVPYNTYGDVTLKFKDNLMQPGEVDEFLLTPISQDEADLSVLKSARPYQIKAGSDRDNWELKQK